MRLTSYASYMFVFAHPDDEVYCCALMQRLVATGKAVHAVYITNGDAGGDAEERSVELAAALQPVGITPGNIHQLGISESSLLQSYAAAIVTTTQLAKEYAAECIVSMDYEGGHEGHDSAHYIAAQAAAASQAAQYVYPGYHAEQGRRVGNAFVPGREANETLRLTDSEASLKISVLGAHRGQVGHFLHLQRADPTYFPRLFTQELYRQITTPIDYGQPPATEIGYESHRNGYKFADFQQAIAQSHDLAA